MFQFLDRVPSPEIGEGRVGRGKMQRIAKHLVSEHRGEMFERHRRGEIEDGRTVFGLREEGDKPCVDTRQVVTRGGGPAVETQVFAGVMNLLLDEIADVCRQRRICPFAMRPDRRNEKRLAARKDRRQRKMPA